MTSHLLADSQVLLLDDDPHLRQAFSFHTLLVGGDPFKTSSVYALIHALERRGGLEPLLKG